MRSGELRNLVAVQSRSTSQDALGGQSTTWALVKNVWVAINPLYGRELLAAKAIATEVSHQITARYESIWSDPRTAVAYRILFGTRIFNLHAVMNDDERKASVTIYASEGLSDG